MPKHTADSFRKNEAMVSAYSEILQQPVVELALGVVRDLGKPTELAIPSGVSFLEWNAFQNARREGFHHALDMIEALAAPIAKRRSDRDLMPSLVADEE